MKAYVTSIGEPTTDLCIKALERQGFEVQLVYNEVSTLADKLAYIYAQAEDDFIRVDADVIVNKNIHNISLGDDIWWVSGSTFDWYKQDVTSGGVQFIRKEAIPHLREWIKDATPHSRPESYLYRHVDAFYNPRRCLVNPAIFGIHGYGQKDIDRVKQVKEERGQLEQYDFELAEMLNDA